MVVVAVVAAAELDLMASVAEDEQLRTSVTTLSASLNETYQCCV